MRRGTLTQPVRLAVIGTNFISDRLAEAAAQVPRVRLAAVLSRSAERGQDFAARHGISTVYTELDALLADSAVDAVYIASPMVCHEAQSIAALHAGKHVLCEKMIADTYQGYLRMRSAALASNRVLLEAMRPAHDPTLALLRGQLSELGRIRRVELRYCQYSSRYDRFRSGILTNAFDPAMHNSALADIGIYPLFLLHALFGAPEGLTASSVFLHNGFEGEGTVLMTYPDGMLATVAYSKITEAVIPSVIEGEDASLTLDRINAPTGLTLWRRGEEPCSIAIPPCENNMVYELDAFARMIAAEAPWQPHLDLTGAVMHTVDRIDRAAGISARFN